MPRPKGNGAGWGGPAKGEGKKGHVPGSGRPPGVKNGEGKQARAREALEAAQDLAIATIIEIASDRNDQRALAAALSILNRTGLHEKSGVEHSGPDGGPPLVMVRKFFEPLDKPEE